MHGYPGGSMLASNASASAGTSSSSPYFGIGVRGKTITPGIVSASR